MGTRLRIGFFLIVLLPPAILLLMQGDAYRAFLSGALLWAVGVVLKGTTVFFVDWSKPESFRPEEHPVVWASVLGVISAATELGTAAVYFYGPGSQLDLIKVLAFGAGASSIEVLYLIWETRGNAPDGGADAMMATASTFFYPLLERVLALVAHIAHRGLVYIGIRDEALLPAAIGLVLFSIMDGVPSWIQATGRSFEDTRVLNRYYAFIAMLDAVGIVTFLAYWGF